MAELTPLETKVLDAVDEGWLVDRLRRLVAVPSVGGTDAEADVQAVVAGWLADLGCEVDHWPIDLEAAASAPDAPGQEVVRSEAWGVVGTLAGTEGGQPALILSGHTDVVPAGDRALWPGDPFEPRLAGGAVHGRGSCDMKAGLVASLGVVAALRTAGVELPRALAVHAVIGEEDGGLGAWATLARGHRGAACVIPEPTAGAVVSANAGALTFRLEVPGRAAHAAYRDEGVSAVELFEELHADLRDLEAERQIGADPRFGGARFPYGLSIGKVVAGGWASSVPDRLVAEGRFGVQLGEPVQTARATFEDRVARFCAGHAWLADHPAAVTWTGGSFASGQLLPGSTLLAEMQEALADIGLAVPVERAISAGSDLRLYAAAGIPTVHYGPGDLRLAHGPDERVPVADLVSATRALALLAVRSAGAR